MKEKPNLDYIESLAAGEDAFKTKFINILQEEFPEERGEYWENMGNSLLREASLNVHKLKHKLSILGLTEGYVLAVEHEEALRDGNRDHEKKFEEILDTVESFLKTI